MDAFISYSACDADFAIRLENGLTAQGISVWVDHDNIRVGGLLVAKLQAALQSSKNIVVLWSKASSKSPWVTTEWTSVVNLNHQKETTSIKGVIPCLLDNTPLAMFLLNYVYCDFRASYDDAFGRLLEALKGRIAENTPPPVRWRPSEFVTEISRRQFDVLSALSMRNVAEAKKVQGRLNPIVDTALRENPSDHYIVTLAGYNKKNEYLIRYWDDIQAGKSPKDVLLDEAIEIFFRALSVQPDDPSVLNGIGSVFIMRHDLDAAEFYIGRALARSKEEGLNYAAAEHDLALVRHLKGARKTNS